MMPYQVKLRPLAEREAAIRAAVKATRQTREFFEFRSQKCQLPLVRIPENTLLYRMENFRTYIDQRAYILREGKPQVFFLVGQENESVQQLQHEILAKLARKGVADSVTPVIEVLRADKQREPLLITYRGIVVNGNRRLAGMRELYSEDEGAFVEFSSIDCLVLPEDATPDEIVDIEAALQAKPETRLDYDWIGDCLLIERLLATHKNPETVAQRLNRKPAEIKNSLAALAEANVYLRDWARSEGEYSRVLDAEQLFKDLPVRLEDKSPALADASRIIAWTLFENRDELKERLYAFNVTFGKRASDVLERVAENLNVDLVAAQAESEGDFDIDIGEDESAVTYGPIIDALQDPARKEEAVEAIIDVCRGVVEDEKGIKGGAAALKAITQANRRLKDVEVGAADPSTYDKIDLQLKEIATRVDGLSKILAKLRGTTTGKNK